MTEPAITEQQARGRTMAVALVLPGGRADSFHPTTSRQLAGVRMRPFASSLGRAGRGHGLAVWSLRYRYRGWNGAEMSPVADTRWALEEVRRRHGRVPVVLVGHSMGGRTALRVADDDDVTGVVALAPWLPPGEPTRPARGRQVLIAHGAHDAVTSPQASRRYADQLAAAGGTVDVVIVRGDSHAMLLRWRAWQRLTTAYALHLLELRQLSPALRRVLARGFI